MIETNMSVMDVPMAAGLNSDSLFLRHFKTRYGEPLYGQRGRNRARDL